MANEKGTGQTESANDELAEMWCLDRYNRPMSVSESPLERGTVEGESPVHENRKGEGEFQSTGRRNSIGKAGGTNP